MPSEGALAITGAAGRIGSVLRPGLIDLGPIRSIDVKPIEDLLGGERFFESDVRDLAALEEAFAGARAVVHLAAIPTEASFQEILDVNIRGTQHVFEAARRTEGDLRELRARHRLLSVGGRGRPRASRATGHLLRRQQGRR
jgi:nucleoside-diphosphate-sugar epimerase